MFNRWKKKLGPTNSAESSSPTTPVAKSQKRELREFAYLDEVSVLSLVASRDGSIISERNEQISGALRASAGADTTVGVPTVAQTKISAQVEAELNSGNTILRRDIIQSTFEDLYTGEKDRLLFGVTPSKERAEVEISKLTQRKPDDKRIIPPAQIERGRLFEIRVELSVDDIYVVRSAAKTLLDLPPDTQSLMGINGKDEQSISASFHLIDSLLLGLVPIRAKAVDYVVTTVSGQQRIVHKSVLPDDQSSIQVQPLIVAAVATESNFWKDIRQVGFSKREFNMMCRVAKDGLTEKWDPLPMADVFGAISQEIAEPIRQLGSVSLSLIRNEVDGQNASRLTGAIKNYAGNLIAEVKSEIPVKDAIETALPILGKGDLSEAEAWAQACEQVEKRIEGTDTLDRESLADLREKEWKASMASEPKSAKEQSPKDMIIESEIVAIYW